MRRYGGWLLAGGLVIVGIGMGWRPWGGEVPASRERSAVPARVVQADDARAWRTRVVRARVAAYPELLHDALAIGDGRTRERVLRALLRRWLARDPRGLVAFLDQVELGRDGGEETWAMLAPSLARVLPRVHVEDAEAALELARELVGHLAAGDPAAALAWARRALDGDARDAAFVTVAGELAARSPDEALAVLEAIAAPYRRLEGLGQVGSGFAEAAPEGAAAWASGLPRESERVLAMEGVLETLARRDPATASAILSRFDATLTPLEMPGEGDGDGDDDDAAPSLVKNDHLSSVGRLVAQHWAADDPAAALAWAESLAPGRMQREGLQGALFGWATRDPRAAWAWLAGRPEVDPWLAESVFAAWATSAPRDAAAAAARLEAAALRAHAVPSVVDRWLAQDPAGAAAWVDALPPGAERDAALLRVIDASGLDDPTSAWGRALSIANAGLRRDALGTAFAAMIASDPAWAGTVLQQSGLTAAEQRPLARMLAAVEATS